MNVASPIAKLNDLLRTTFLGGRVMLTSRIKSLPGDTREAVLSAIRAFDRFDTDNDPHGDHDFGAIDHAEAGRVFWKIDYYDHSLAHGSENPSDPATTCRVLTIMLAEEY